MVNVLELESDMEWIFIKKDTDMDKLKNALSNDIWINHKIGNEYQMDGKKDKWKIAYYPIFEDGKTNELYEEPRALVEKEILGKYDEKIGTDFREVPLRYLTLLNQGNTPKDTSQY